MYIKRLTCVMNANSVIQTEDYEASHNRSQFKEETLLM